MKGKLISPSMSSKRKSKLSPVHSITYALVDLSLTSLPWFCKNSTSCWEKVVMEIDLTLWGGLSPLLKQKQTASTNCVVKHETVKKRSAGWHLFEYKQEERVR